MSAPRLQVDARKRLGGFQLDVQLEADTGILVLFGPSGAGKTTTLDLIAGLLQPESGRIALDGRVFFRTDEAAGGRRRTRPLSLPARDRHVGYVFQQYALFPHLTALQNVMFPLRRVADAERRAHELLERVRLDGLGHHFPRELSGGQQQRVALARALAARPALLLLDEPFSALDAAIREHLQRDVAALQQELGLVVLYVTHRLEDAFAVGQRIAVVRDGRLEQTGLIDEVFRRPANERVAESMGIRNLLQVTVLASSAEELLLDWHGLRLSAPPQPAQPGRALAYIRPEEVKLLYSDRPVSSSVAQNRFTATVERSARGAAFRELTLRLPNGREIELRSPLLSYGPMNLTPGASVEVALRKEAIVVLGA